MSSSPTSSCDELLQSESHQNNANVTEELHKPARRRVIWEVHAGRGRVSSVWLKALVLRLKCSYWTMAGTLINLTIDVSSWNVLTLKSLVKLGSLQLANSADGTSQSGYFVLLAPKGILETGEDVYHILDWMSFKLPRHHKLLAVPPMRQSLHCATSSTWSSPA